jgi:hypothetical protein
MFICGPRTLSTHLPRGNKNKQKTVDELIEDGERYSQTSGVELKFDGEVHGIDWNVQVSWEDIEEIVRRCMAKYPSIVPTELSLRKAEVLLGNLPGLTKADELTEESFRKIVERWDLAYRENLDKVMFDNLSSYEP